MNHKSIFYFIAAFLFSFISCEEDETLAEGTGIVSFSIDDIREIENADQPITIYIGVDTFTHGGGSVGVEITGGQYGTDFETSEGSGSFTLDLEPGTLVSSFSIAPVDNNVIGQNKQLTITLASASGSLEVGESNSISYTIIENDEPQVAIVGFETETVDIQENAIEATTINLLFDKVSTNGGTITINGTGDAIIGTDFTLGGATELPFTIDVVGGSDAASFEITPIDNDEFAEDKTMTFTLTGVDGALEIGSQIEALVTFTNDDAPAIPVIDFTNATTSIAEDGGTVTIDLVLSSVTTEDATVEIAANVSSTATLGTDYDIEGQTTSPYILHIASGSSTASLDINIVDDMDTESDETIVLDVSNVTGGAQVGVGIQQQTITITDNDEVAIFSYLETFESHDGTGNPFLNDVLGYQQVILDTQDISDQRIDLINNAGSFSDPDDETGTSDNGLNLFYNSQEDPANFGTLDNMVITPVLEGTGSMDIHIDVSYAFQNQNSGEATFYWSDTYDGNGTFDESEWTALETVSVASLGIGNNNYSRREFSIEPASNFYIAIRVNQEIDASNYRTRWRFDNIRVEGQ